MTMQPIIPLLLTLLATGAAFAGGVPVDLAAPPVTTSLIFYSDAGGGQRGVPIHTGDFDGDGKVDVAASPFSANTLGRTQNGVVNILFGDGTTGGTINIATYSGKMLSIYGAEDFSLLGLEMGVADFDHDGYDDLVMGSSHGKFIADAPGAGEVVILFGRLEWGTTVKTLDIRSLPVDQRAKFILGQRSGTTVGDRLGSWFTIRDFDENNHLDLMMGMDLSDGPSLSRTNCGAAVILWDVTESFPAAPYLRVGDAATSSAFTVIYGANNFDQFGATNEAGDLDGDGHLDLVVAAGVTRSGLQIDALNYSGSGAGDGPGNARSNCGEATIFWDARSLRALTTLDLAVSLPTGIATTTLYGETSADYFGEELFIANVVGTSTKDLVIGALLADGGTGSGTQNGSTYIVPGGADLRALTTLDMASPPANFVSVIDGTQPYGIAGDTIELCDINKDGKIDILNSIPYGDVTTARTRAGYTVVLFGGQTLPQMPTRIKMNNLTTTPALMTESILGIDKNDFFAYSSGSADVNEDGYVDYIANAMQGDGFQNGFSNAGEDYIVDGLTICKYASAPTNVHGDSAAPAGSPVAYWTASQPILGPVLNYELLYLPNASITPIVITTNALHLIASDFPNNGTILSIRAVMQRGAETNRSIDVLFNPPISVLVVPPPTPSPTPSPLDAWITH